MSNTFNIYLPAEEDIDASEYWRRPTLRDTMIESLQYLETIKHSVGLNVVEFVSNNMDLCEEMISNFKAIRNSRPSKANRHQYNLPDPSVYSPMFNRNHRGVTVNKSLLPNGSLEERLEDFKHNQREMPERFLQHHLNVDQYKNCEVTLSDDGSVNFELERATARSWSNNSFCMSYKLKVPRNWYASGAPDVMVAANNRFFPLTCEAIPSRAEHRLYKIKRLRVTKKGNSLENNIKIDDGYFAILRRRGKDPLTGWGETPEEAAGAVNKSRAKEASKRLLAA